MTMAATRPLDLRKAEPRRSRRDDEVEASAGPPSREGVAVERRDGRLREPVKLLDQVGEGLGVGRGSVVRADPGGLVQVHAGGERRGRAGDTTAPPSSTATRLSWSPLDQAPG